MKYLDMENAQIEIEINTLSNLKKFIEESIDNLEKLNIKRLTIKTSYKEIDEFIKLINSIDFEKISYLIMIKTNLLDTPKTAFDNILIINTSNKIIEHDNIYNQIILKKEEIDNITKLLHQNINVIVEPSIDINNIKEFNDLLNELYDKNIEIEILLGGFLIPLSLIKEHPCNAYLCNGWKCGKKISQLPKVIYIDESNKMYPHYITDEKICLGNFNKDINNSLKEYLKSNEFKTLKEIEKKVFIKYVLNYPYELFPLDKYIEWEMQNDK